MIYDKQLNDHHKLCTMLGLCHITFYDDTNPVCDRTSYTTLLRKTPAPDGILSCNFQNII